MRQLFPIQRDDITVAEACADPIRRKHTDGRPWLELCMVASIDGATAADGTSRALGSPADTAILIGLRAIADIIIVGAGTIRAEAYGKPSKPGQRIGAVTTSPAGLDANSELFSSGSGFVITSETATTTALDTIRAGHGHVDLAAAFRQLDAMVVQGEGGAGLNGSLFDADLVDEINMTLSPNVCGGDSKRVVAGAAARLQRYELRHVLEEDGFLFTRYVRR